MELSSLLKIVPLTINCDTLLITTSSVFEVKHVNSDDVEELKRIVEECKDRYRIVVLSEDYLSGREIVKKIEDSRSKDYEKSVEMGGEDNEGNMDKLMQTMINKTKKTKSKLQLKREIRRLTQKIYELGENIDYKNYFLQVDRSGTRGRKLIKEMYSGERKLALLYKRKIALYEQLETIDLQLLDNPPLLESSSEQYKYQANEEAYQLEDNSNSYLGYYY